MEVQDLIRKISLGDESAFEKLFTIFYKSLCSYAFGMIKDRDQAEEIVQDILFKIWQSRSDLKLDLTIRAYLYRSVYNRCLNYFRHEKVKQEYQSYNIALNQNSYESASSRLTYNELSAKINEGIDTLPPACRKVFRLSRMEGLSYKEIAGILEISVKTVENQMGKALKMMRKHLADFISLGILFCLENYFFHEWGSLLTQVFITS